MLAGEYIKGFVLGVLEQFVEIPKSNNALRFFGSGGSVITLHDVALKDAPLKELNLPVKLKSSRIGTFTLKMALHKAFFLVRSCRCCC